MRALVVYESMFGNTRTIAEAVRDGLGEVLRADAVEVGEAPAALPDDVRLLVVGGPTHAFGLSRPSTRRDAAGQAAQPVVSRSIGLREWLSGLAGVSVRMGAAAFDTHIHKPRVPGSAARAAHRRLGRLGFRLLVEPESFYVTDSSGPLLEGEADRARRWGAGLGAEAAAHDDSRRVG